MVAFIGPLSRGMFQNVGHFDNQCGVVGARGKGNAIGLESLDDMTPSLGNDECSWNAYGTRGFVSVQVRDVLCPRRLAIITQPAFSTHIAPFIARSVAGKEQGVFGGFVECPRHGVFSAAGVGFGLGVAEQMEGVFVANPALEYRLKKTKCGRDAVWKRLEHVGF